MKNPKVFPDPMRGAEQSFFNQVPNELEQGLTMLDYFAAKTMQSICNSESYNTYTYDKIAEFSYNQAEAMLKEREKRDINQ